MTKELRDREKPALPGLGGDKTTKDLNPDATPSNLAVKLGSKNKRDFVRINLDELSALRLADVKLFSCSSSSVLQITILKAQELQPVKGGIPPSPLVMMAIKKENSKDHEKKIDVKKPHVCSKIIQKSSFPIWNESLDMKIDSISAEVKSILLVELRDKTPKGDFLGCFEIVLNNMADNIQREEWFTLQRKKKKDKVSGQLLIRTQIRPEKKVEEAIILKNEKLPAIPSFIYNSYWNAHCVKQLSVSNCGITSIPEAIHLLNSLELIVLDHNQISTVPKSLGRIYTLKCIDLSHNRISELPDELANLKNLQLLSIVDNLFDAKILPGCLPELDIWCEVEGKLEAWEPLMENERLRRATSETEEHGDAAVLAEKEMEIQRLLAGIK